MPVSPSVRPVECRRRCCVRISHIGTVNAAGIPARTVFPVGIAGIDGSNIRVAARRRIGQLVQIVPRPRKYRPLVDQIHFRRTGLCNHHPAAAVCPAATPAGVDFRHQSNGETCYDRKYTEKPKHPARALRMLHGPRRAHVHAQSSAATGLLFLQVVGGILRPR
jgi:hypothetical protein